MTPPSSASEAKQLGLTRYFTGKPCPNGHVAWRHASSRSCVKCQSALADGWRERNLERARAAAAKRQMRWAQRNPEKAAAWSTANVDRRRSIQRAYQKRNRAAGTERVMQRYAAKRQQTPTWRNVDVMRAIYAVARAYREAGIDCHVDHIYPLRGRTVSGLHIEHNLQILPAEENMKKGNRVSG